LHRSTQLNQISPDNQLPRQSMPSTPISRRSFLANAALAGLAFQTRGLYAQSAATPVTVRTPSGALRGETAEGVRIFRGIPFAEPPVGPLRFRPPVPVKPWSGDRDALLFSPSPMQWHEATPPELNEPALRHNEDCLYLNIWAPEGQGPFPVLVWIHGGGYTAGHAFETLFNGNEFANQGIICITVAYRLGIFGFLNFGPLFDVSSNDPHGGVSRFGAPYAGSANNALLDLIVALEWIQKNVSAFGGDPNRVTIGGESAGAKLTDILMGIPSAQSLFHQMISESGGAERVWPLAGSAAVAVGFSEQWRKTGQDIPAMLTAPADQLIEVQHSFLEQWPQHFPLRPEADGHLLPQLPVRTIAAGSTRGKRLLIGTNRDENALFIGPHPKDVYPHDLGNLPPAQFEQVFRRYMQAYPQLSPEQMRIRAVTAEEYWIPSIRVADAHVQGGGTAWMYRLDFAETSGRLAGYSYHSLDVGMVWERPHLNPANAAAETALSKQLHQAWVAFIRGEAPTAPGLPTWPQYSTPARPTMILDTQSHIENQPQETELRLWDGVL
jgi:para-nitrobenzyl esterase